MAERQSNEIELTLAGAIERRIYVIRGQQVMLDFDLADLYGVRTGALNQAVGRNADRFPKDFAFQLNGDELEALMSQIVTSNAGRGGRRKFPWAFTEHGILMLSSVLRSDRAVQVNIRIVRAFVRLRQLLDTDADLRDRVYGLECQLEVHGTSLRFIYDAVEDLRALL